MHLVSPIIKFTRNIKSIVLVANLAEGKYMFSSSIRHEYDFANNKIFSYSIDVNRRVILNFFGS